MGDYSDSNGGSIWNANFLQCLGAIKDIEFVVMSIGPAEVGDKNRHFVEGLGFKCTFVAYRNLDQNSSNAARASRCCDIPIDLLVDKYYFTLERFANGQTHVDDAFVKSARAINPDLVLVVYLFTGLLIPSVFQIERPVCMITVNNESEFHKCARRSFINIEPGAGTVGRFIRTLMTRNFNWLSNRRLMKFEKRVYEACAGLATLSPHDIPEYLPSHIERETIHTLLAPCPVRWRYSATRSLFFVGSIQHFPNRLAIDWICQRFAPVVYRMDSTVAITIIGADAGQMHSTCISGNIRFLGRSTREEVESSMASCDLFIAPIENTFGAKLKLAECVSYGIPFLATTGALSGLSFLNSIPQIHLDEPEVAAQLAIHYIDNPPELKGLSRTVRLQAEDQMRKWPGTCRDFLRRSAASFLGRQGAVIASPDVVYDP